MSQKLRPSEFETYYLVVAPERAHRFFLRQILQTPGPRSLRDISISAHFHVVEREYAPLMNRRLWQRDFPVGAVLKSMPSTFFSVRLPSFSAIPEDLF